MLYFDKLTMMLVLGFAIGLAWISVPPADLEPPLFVIKPISDYDAHATTYEITRRSARLISATMGRQMSGPLSHW